MAPRKIGAPAARARRATVALVFGLVAALSAQASLGETMLAMNYNPSPSNGLSLAAVADSSDASSVLAASLSSLSSSVLAASTEESAAVAGDASLTGAVYWDVNKNGVRESTDYGVADASVSIAYTGTSAVLATVLTGRDGSYSFTGLAAGQYTITLLTLSEQPETPSVGEILSAQGVQVLTGLGTASVPNLITSVELSGGDTAVNYDFPQLIYPTQLLSKRMLLNTDPGVPHTPTPTPVPEPSSLLLCLIGLVVGGANQSLRASRNARSRS